MEESDICLCVLGPVEIHIGATGAVSLPPKPRLLLATLALAGSRVVSFSRIVEVLWEDCPPPSARANLRAYAATIRSALGDGMREQFRRCEYGYQLVVRPGDLDADVFASYVAEAEAALAEEAHARTADLLERGLRLWRGPAGEGLPAARLLAGPLGALTEQRLAAQEMLSETRLALGDHRGQIPVLEQILAAHPLRERSWAALMRARYASGDVAGALTAFRQCREVLNRQLGIEPGDELARLQRAMLNREPPEAAPCPREQLTLPHFPHRQDDRRPTQDVFASTVFGRAAELECLRQLLRGAADDPASPTVIVHGRIGAGTSSLAAKAAADLAVAFPDGVWRLDLDRRRNGDTDNLPGWPPAPGARVLLLIDHALTAAEVRPFASPPAGCVVLVTSGGPLGALDGAYRMAVPPLSPQAGTDLLAGVLGRQRIVNQQAAAHDLVAYCEGLPLALRACAARLMERTHEPIAALARRLADPRERLHHLVSDDLDIRERIRSRFLTLCTADPLVVSLLGRLSVVADGAVDAARLAAELKAPIGVIGSVLDRFVAGGLLTLTEHLDLYVIGELTRLVAAELIAGRIGPVRGDWQAEQPQITVRLGPGRRSSLAARGSRPMRAIRQTTRTPAVSASTPRRLGRSEGST